MPIDLNFKNADFKKLQNELIQIGKDAVSTWLNVAKEDGKEAAEKAKEFAEMAKELTAEAIRGDITQESFKDSLDDLELALESYLITQSYKKSRKHLRLLVKILKRTVNAAIKILSAIV